MTFDATFDVEHSKECIYEVSSKLKEVLGLIDNVLVLERESFDILVEEMRGTHYTLEKAVKLNLKDYKPAADKHVILLKLTTRDHIPLLVISDMLHYQS